MNLTNKAIQIAKTIHYNEKYGTLSYLFHLNQVLQISNQYFGNDEYQNALAILHDVGETLIDRGFTRYGVKKILLSNGLDRSLVEDVLLLTDQEGENRKDRHIKTYTALSNSLRATRAKLSDRLANVSMCAVTNNERKLEMYKRENTYFMQCLDVWNDEKNKKIIKKINSYFQ